MKICITQTNPIKGDIETNIARHKKFIELAVSNAADIIIFPELSLTGYEPSLAKELATDANDIRLNDFQIISDTHQISIGVGLPTKSNAGICISMIFFQPNNPRQVYSKKYLHADEELFFVSGANISGIKIKEKNVALAICYELSVPQHSEDAFKSGAEIYIASVAKTATGVEKAFKTLSDTASKYSMTTLMSNSVGLCEDGLCAGQSAVWNNKGVLITQLDNTSEGILIFDTETQKVVNLPIS